MSYSPQNQDSLGEKLKVAFDSNNSDKNYNALKAVVSSVPAVGSLAVGFFDSYIVPPATQRTYKFLEILVQELEKLKSKIESVDFESPIFLTTFLHVSQIACRTHKEQKLEALRNLVLNSSIPHSLEDDILAMFLNWIDDFTELHIYTLKHLHYLNRYGLGELQKYFPMLEKNRAIYNQILKDLEDRGLIFLKEDYITKEDVGDAFLLEKFGYRSLIPPSMDAEISRRDHEEKIMRTVRHKEDIDKLLKMTYLPSKTTQLGKQFIEFIEYPSIQTESM